jgi:hypothetical protein
VLPASQHTSAARTAEVSAQKWSTSYIPFLVVFPKNGFAKAKAVENKEELPVVYGQQSIKGMVICPREASRLAESTIWLRSGGSDKEGGQTVLDAVGDHGHRAVFGIEPGALLGKPLCRAGNIE